MPSLRDVRANWDVDMPWRQKVHLALRNTLIKLARRQSCCGNTGEPGC